MDHLKKQPIFGKIDDPTKHPFKLPKFGAIPLPKPSQKHASESGKGPDRRPRESSGALADCDDG
ncbi:hypothetical protein QCA50_008254 [Cerrena zonata]|uniref:Uncharacterized protein n=1 Tax=Cerrena zonata TaxID=2478898 RepID=A0AAW0G5S0_9APHY